MKVLLDCVEIGLAWRYRSVELNGRHTAPREGKNGKIVEEGKAWLETVR